MAREHKTYSGENTELGSDVNISWAAYHAQNQESSDTPTALLPLFHESAHTVAMIRHSMDVVKRLGLLCTSMQSSSDVRPATLYQTDPVEVAREVWRRMIMFGGLHIEMAAFRVLPRKFILGEKSGV